MDPERSSPNGLNEREYQINNNNSSAHIVKSYNCVAATSFGMDKKTLKKFEEKLRKSREEIEKSLSAFATKDTEVKGDWDTKFPEFGRDPNLSLEEAADEVEEYVSRLPVEHAYEIMLRDINEALDGIKKGTYGTCSNCEKKIPLKRLEAYPEAGHCLNCQG